MGRHWRIIKYQYIYLNPYENRKDLYIGIKDCLERYHERQHQDKSMEKPAMRYANTRPNSSKETTEKSPNKLRVI